MDVLTIAEWDKKEEPLILLEKCEKGIYKVVFPLFLVFYIIRSWKYEKLSDRIVRRLDKITQEFLRESEIDRKLKEKIRFGLRFFTRKVSKELFIGKQDAAVLIYASISGVDYLVTYDKTDFQNKEQKISTLLKGFGLHVPKMVTPDKLISS